MTLQDKLDDYKAEFKESVPEEKQKAMAQATEDLKQSGILDDAISAGNPLPRFDLANQDSQMVNSDDLLEEGPLVITVFRGVWCPYCSIELQEIEAYADRFREAGATLVAISPQLKEYARKTREKFDLSFDVLVDEGNEYARKLGIVHSLPDNVQEIYKDLGIDIPEHNGEPSWQLPLPTRLVVNRQGKVIYADVSPDYTVRPDPQETLDALRDRTDEAA